MLPSGAGAVIWDRSLRNRAAAVSRSCPSQSGVCLLLNNAFVQVETDELIHGKSALHPSFHFLLAKYETESHECHKWLTAFRSEQLSIMTQHPISYWNQIKQKNTWIYINRMTAAWNDSQNVFDFYFWHPLALSSMVCYTTSHQGELKIF